MSQTIVKTFYASQVRQEWRRLVKDAYHNLELLTTLRYLEKYLPPDGHILDAGGGPGRYTIELARRGYQVRLLDLTPENVAFASRQIARRGLKRQAQAVEGSIIDLTRYADGTFDAVTCLGGPLSHILDAHERARAIGELLRVSKPGAPVFISVMSRLSVLVIELQMFQHELGTPVHNLLRETGDIDGTSGFTACHFFLPEEFKAEVEAQGTAILEMVGLEGAASRQNKQVNQIAKIPARWQSWLETHYQTCTHPAVVGLSEHMLIVCRKSEQKL
jgi:SAM-dependent methyltransferase